MGRVGDYSNKQYLYKFYRRGYSSWHNKYIDIASGQYIGHTVEYISGTPISVDATSLLLMVAGSGGSSEGVSTTDAARPISITGVNAVFNPTYSVGGFGSISYFYLELLGYKVNYDISASNIELYKDNVLVDTQTISSSYDHIRIREDEGDLLIENSSNGTTWTVWDSFTIDYDTDVTSSQLKFGFSVGSTGPGNVIIDLGDVLITDKAQQLLGIESENVTSPLTFSSEINTPASKTTVTLNYAPGEVPDYIKLGNNVEMYANFYDWSSKTEYEAILDQNGDPILDQNSQIIYGKVLNQGSPETINNLKFSGYIESIDYDYDSQTIAITVVSHGELMANVLVYGEDIESSILKQELYNASVATTVARYQTVRFYKQVKIDSLAFRWSASGGGSMSYTIASSSGTNIATSETLTWGGGGLGVGVHKLSFDTPVYLEPGVYRIGLAPSPANYTISYQNTNVYPDGSWSGGAGDLYFDIFTELPSFNELLSGTTDVLVGELFDYLSEKYTLLRQGDVDVSSYDIQIQTNIDTTLSVMERIQSQSDTGWWWHVDPGTNYLTLQEPDTTPDHVLVLGRDFTEFKLSESIGEIINTAVFTGGEISEGVNLAVLAQDFESIANYKYGLDISSNEKVTRFDSASLLVNNTISNNNTPRYTTDITVSAALYDIETFKIGDLVKLTNGDSKLNSLLLTIAGLSYSPTSITLNLDTAPVSINKTVESIRRELQNAATANVEEIN